MAAPRRGLPAPAANEDQSMDPRVVNSVGPAPATSQGSTLVDFSHGDAVDQEFAFLGPLLEADINSDFSFTEFLDSTTDTNAFGFAATGHGPAFTEYPDPSLSEINSFFNMDSANQPVGSGVTNDLASQGFGSQFDESFNMVLPDDPPVFPPGFESAANVAASTPTTGNPDNHLPLKGVGSQFDESFNMARPNAPTANIWPGKCAPD
ncbi:uncharacterized protein Z520_07399 [Fonsecaea multimorphosa CBS 102226]|uniref:Uncharacterized protein n=1 Tax=Fonsecaea multimorphosa CBS 102226 TaxID=1442371 RepID=A0A0D2H4A6_9EURO|nr:uncharacterized protein Z520_07399 [Fonsecaea multimorphosa CBS 102226]KIX96680.1 hypothetical protein Z520_07399 [Fonsecaea multimorphosa CBS 102226]